ncbi:hypothetical protein PIB30_009638 [Stylosanthes scabra]|uniref:Dirigent protein n=1 Tax=Stylosanthes scabra TaxID=79078 RepID=A0ABU6T554_9FABA|nr:hypothetical protein [Stylosanthes scabra]
MSDRSTLTLNFPRNASVVAMPHVFTRIIVVVLVRGSFFVAQHEATRQVSLHKGRFSGTITSGIGELMRFYHLKRDGTLEANTLVATLFVSRCGILMVLGCCSN